MAEEEQPIVRFTVPNRSFEGHRNTVTAIAVFADECRMATSSTDKTIRIWDLEDGVVLKEMQGHGTCVRALAVSRDGQLIASGDEDGKLVVWHGDVTGEYFTQINQAHFNWISSLDFSRDGAVLASGSLDKTTKLWNTETWRVPMDGNPISNHNQVHCVRFSPSGEFVAIATTNHIEIWNTRLDRPNTSLLNFRTRKCIAKIDVWHNYSLAWTPDGTCLLSGHQTYLREWDTSTWQQIGDPWTGHTSESESSESNQSIYALAVNSTGTSSLLVYGNHVRLWQRSDRQTIAIFEHSNRVNCVAFSANGKHIFSGGRDYKISQWAVPEVGSHSFQCCRLSSRPRIQHRQTKTSMPIARSLCREMVTGTTRFMTHLR
jgi:WD40 repeat protein